MKKIYLIGIGGILISGIARYYNENGYKVFGSDKTNSVLIDTLREEGIDIIIGERPEIINKSFLKIIYTEAIPKNQKELEIAQKIGIKKLTGPEAIGELTEDKKLICISGTHGKSTTSSIVSLLLKNSPLLVNSIVGSILKEFDGKNVFFSKSDYFVLEACEYNRSFLQYKPFIAAITNIELDHLDYYKDLKDYISGFIDFSKNIRKGGYLILDYNDKNSKKLLQIRNDINYIIINNEKFIIKKSSSEIEEGDFPILKLHIPGNHILYDAKIAYCIGMILGLEKKVIIKNIENYNGIWRRSEIIGKTLNGNIVISDYGHHPTEIKLNLKALKDTYKDKKILTIFQPHQYNRTIRLLDLFFDAFKDTDILIIPNIYESRDTKEDKKKINAEKLVDYINHKEKYYGNGFGNTLKMINKFDNDCKNGLVIILQGAGDIDDLRYKLKYK